MVFFSTCGEKNEETIGVALREVMTHAYGKIVGYIHMSGSLEKKYRS